MRFVLADGAMQQVPYAAVNFNFFQDIWQKAENAWNFVTGPSQDVRPIAYQLFGWLYENVTGLVTTFPVDIIQDDHVRHLTLVFSAISVGMVGLFGMLEGFKRMAGTSYTKLGDFMGRTVLAMLGAGLTYPALLFLMGCFNLISHALLSLGKTNVVTSGHFENLFSMFVHEGISNFIVMILFTIAYLGFSIKILLGTGRRWFDLITNSVMAPIAWATLVTDGTKSFFYNWLQSTWGLLLVNLVYAFYLTILTVIVMSPWEAHSKQGILVRVLLIIGSIWRIASPPGWVKRLEGESDSSMMKGFLNATMLRRLVKLK